jgi:hypothetical protein
MGIYHDLTGKTKRFSSKKWGSKEATDMWIVQGKHRALFKDNGTFSNRN